jgi:uncharacterized OB-fold protein
MSDDPRIGPAEPVNESIETLYATDEISKPFWASLAAGQLILPKCGACESVFFYPRRLCPRCWSGSIEWIESAGIGTVFARSEVHVAFQYISEADLPFTVGLIDLDEGVRLPGRFHDDDLQIGDRVRLRFSKDPRYDLPRFARYDSQPES